MNQTEALSLVSYLNRAGLLQALEGQAAVWADALDDVAIGDAREAARALAKTTARWVTPGDVRARAAEVRRQRVRDLPPAIPPESIDPDDVRAQIAWTRAYWQAIASGADTEQADTTACAAVRVTRPPLVIEAAPRPIEAVITHAGGCACGCLTRPISRTEREA